MYALSADENDEMLDTSAATPLTLVTRCVISDARRKKVFFMTVRWFDSKVQTSHARVRVVATSSKVNTSSGTRVNSTGRRMGGGL